jgi:hypothetical protein
MPDPFAIVFMGEDEMLRTPVQANTLQPTWPDAVKANYRIPPRTRLRFELWDSNALNHRPICVSYIDDVHSHAGLGFVDLRCENGAKVSLIVERARAMAGLGLYYEMRAQDVYVTRVLEESPASRAGLAKDVQLMAVDGEVLRGKDEAGVRSLFRAKAQTGMRLLIKKPGGEPEGVTLKEGPVYPLVNEGVDLK